MSKKLSASAGGSVGLSAEDKGKREAQEKDEDAPTLTSSSSSSSLQGSGRKILNLDISATEPFHLQTYDSKKIFSKHLNAATINELVIKLIADKKCKFLFNVSKYFSLLTL